MSQRCKVCTSNFRDRIDQLFFQKYKLVDIQKHAQDSGLKISTASLSRHSRNCLVGYEPPKSSEPRPVPDDYQPGVPTVATDHTSQEIGRVLSELGFEESVLNQLDPVTYKNVFVSVLKRLTILAGLGAVVKLERHQQGLGRFPIEDIKAVDSLMRQQDLVMSRASKAGENYDIFKASELVDIGRVKFEQTRQKLAKIEREIIKIDDPYTGLLDGSLNIDKTPLTDEERSLLEKRLELLKKAKIQLMRELNQATASDYTAS